MRWLSFGSINKFGAGRRSTASRPARSPGRIVSIAAAVIRIELYEPRRPPTNRDGNDPRGILP